MTTPIRRNGYTAIGVKRVNCAVCVNEGRETPSRAESDLVYPQHDGTFLFVALCGEHMKAQEKLVFDFAGLPWTDA